MVHANYRVGALLLLGILSIATCDDPAGTGGPSLAGRPGTPAFTTAAANPDTFIVNVSWQSAAGAVRYDWVTGINGGTGWNTTGQSVLTNASFRAPRLAGAAYGFCVWGVDVNGARSAESACAAYSPPTGGEPPPVVTVTVTPASPSVQVAQTIQLTATPRNASGSPLTGRVVTWSSNNTSVASVNGSGLVTGIAAGTAQITATSEGISVNVTTTVTTVPPPPPPPPPGSGLLFRSDWGTALGTSAAAVGDGGRWPNLVCPGSTREQTLSIVAGSVAQWTATPNIMQVTNRGTNCGQVETTSVIPQATNIYIRMYIRVEDENQFNFHPVDLNCCGAIQAPLWAIFDPVAGVDYNAKFTINTSASNMRRWRPRDKLRQGVWYRFEWFVEYVSTSARTARIWPRVYDMQGALLYDASSHVGIDQNGGITLQQYYDSGGLATFTDLDLARRFAVGYEGTGGNQDFGRRWFYAAVEIRSDTWAGPVQ